MSRVSIVAGNWKMNKTFKEGLKLTQSVINKAKKTEATVVLATPYIHLAAVADLIKAAPNVKLAAQNCHHEESGAHTGEISVGMLKSIGVDYVLIGHSERRADFGEKSALLAQKVDRVLGAKMQAIFCCGEALSVREAKKANTFVSKQLRDGLFHLSAKSMSKVVIAYEPIWAIGTGVTASAEQAQEMHATIRKVVAKKYGEKIAQNLTILYGGSVKPGNAKELFAKPDVDGGLVGGASLKASDFGGIINAI